MGSRSADKIKFTSFDDLFGVQTSEEAKKKPETGQVVRVPLEELHPFQNHPFRVLEDEEMMEMVASVRQSGVLVPIIVRPDKNGGYEIIAGHRRKRASELAGCKDVPAVIQDMLDDEAVIAMVDSNIQRQNILSSEKAKAYRMKMEAMEHQGVKGGKHTAVLLGEDSGESVRTVHRYIRLTYLNPELLDYVDQKRIPVVAGESLSFLNKKEQGLIADFIAASQVFPSKGKAELLRAESSHKELTANSIRKILGQKTRPVGITIPAKKIQDYFPPDYTKEQIETVIFCLLDSWKEKDT